MSRTRKVYIQKETKSVTQILEMIAGATDNGFPTPYGIVREFINDKGIRKLHTDGFIVTVDNYRGDAYEITDLGKRQY